MKKIHRLTTELRQKLKSPLGLLIRGSFDEAIKELEKWIEREKPSKIISVGDVVSGNMIKHHIFPQVSVIDNKVMREPIMPIPIMVDQTLHVKNPPGTITEESWSAMEAAIRETQRMRILVDGEEDLLTLVAVLCASEGSIVVYGQPFEGIVVVKVNKQMKEKVWRIIERMEKTNSKSKLME